MKDSGIFSLVYRVVKHWNGGVTIPGDFKGKTACGTHCHDVIYKVVVSQSWT